MSSIRRSILAEWNASSEELLNEMESLSETNERLQKNQDWKKAVTEELKILDDNHGKLANLLI